MKKLFHGVVAATLCLVLVGAATAQTQVNTPVTGSPQNINAQAVQNSAAGSLNNVRGAGETVSQVAQSAAPQGPGVPLMPLPSTGDGFSTGALRSGQQQQQIDALQQQVEIMQLRMQMQEIMKKMGATGSGTSEVPMLVGISGARKNVSAEFYTGGALLQARPGEWVTSQWRLSRILPNGVVLSRANGRGQHTLLFGSGNVQGNSQSAPPTAARPVGQGGG